MGFWTGVARAYRDISEERTQERRLQEERELQQQRLEEEREYQRQLREEERAFEREQFDRQLKATLGQTLFQYRLENAAAEDSSDELASYAKDLLMIGVDKDLVSRAVATGDVEALSNLTSTAMENYEQAAAAGREDEYIQILNNTLSSAEMSPSTTAPIDLGGVTELLGTDLSPEALGINDYETAVPGSLEFTPPIYVESPDPADYGDIEERIANNALSQARSEARRLTQATSALQERLEGASGEEESRIRELIGRTTERLTQVQGAIDAYSGENKDAFELLSTYGTSTVDSTLESFPQFDINDLAPAFRENLGQTGINVPSAGGLRDLVDLGVIQEGDVFYYEPFGEYRTYVTE